MAQHDMITIQQDSELMTNYIASEPIPAGRHFAVFRDSKNEPAVLGITDDNELHVILASHDRPTSCNLSESLEIKGKVQALALQQSPDHHLDVTFAVESGAGAESELWILHDVLPEELEGTVPPKKILKGSGLDQIYGLYMGNISKEETDDFPIILAAFQASSEAVKTSDLGFVVIDVERRVTLDRDWSLATNPKRILDVSIGTSKLGQGAFVLCTEDSGKPEIHFKVFRSSQPENLSFQVQIDCPADATCIASYVDPDGGKSSVLLVGGSKIWAYTSHQYLSSDIEGIVIATADKLVGKSTKPILPSLKELHVSQPLSKTADNVHIWFTTTDDAVYYYDTTASTLDKGIVVPLLPEGQGARISGMLSLKPVGIESKVEKRDGDSGEDEESPGTVVSSLITVDDEDKLALLQQDPISKLWQRYKFFHNISNAPLEVKSYLLRFQAVSNADNPNKTGSGALTPGCWLQMRSSGLVRCCVNGRQCTISPAAQWLQTDCKGVLSILLTTDDATCHTFTVDAHRPATSKEGVDEQTLEAKVLDPSQKPLAKLSTIKTVEDLKNAKNSKGEPIISANADEKDLKAAVEAFGQLREHAKTVSGGDWSGPASIPSSTIAPIAGNIFDDIGDAFSEAWHWVEHKAKEAEDWVIRVAHDIEDAAKKAVQFVIKIADTVYNFALNTIETIVKGVTWVFKKVGAFVQDVIDFLGFAFDWDDILTTADSVAACFEATLDYGQTFVVGIERKIDDNLEKLRANIKENLSKIQDFNYKAAGTDETKSSSKLTNTPDHDDDHKGGVAHNWGSDQLKSNVAASKTELDPSSKILQELWDDVQGEITVIAKFFADPMKDLLRFLSTGDYDIRRLIGKVSADSVDKLIDAMRKFVGIVAKALELGFSLVKDIAKAHIDIPVLTWLWENVIAKKRKLNLLNLACLLIAIPTTLLFKVVKKKTPPKLQGRVTADGFKAYVEDSEFATDSTLVKEIELIRLASEGCVHYLAAEFEAVSTVAEGAVDGLKLEKISKLALGSLGTVLDSVLLVFDVIECFQDWPVSAQDKPSDLISWCRWAKYGLKLANTAALIVVVAIRKNVSEDSKPLLKKFRAAMATLSAAPRFAVALTERIHDSTTGEKDAGAQTRGYLADALEFGEQLGFTAASWNDEMENEIMYIGVAVELGCAFAASDVKIADFVVA